MKIIVRVNGISNNGTWKYHDFSYSCKEYDYSDRYTCLAEGKWCTSTTPNTISTWLAFSYTGVTPDTKDRFLAILTASLKGKYSHQIPTIPELKSVSSEVKKCLLPSLKNMCFINLLFHHQDNKDMDSVQNDIIDDFDEFKSVYGLNERW